MGAAPESQGLWGQTHKRVSALSMAAPTEACVLSSKDVCRVLGVQDELLHALPAAFAHDWLKAASRVLSQSMISCLAISAARHSLASV